MSKQIPLSKGKFAIVDDIDFEKINYFKWYAKKDKWNWYAVREVKLLRLIGIKRKIIIYMHQYILDVPDGLIIDHRNRNGLDNRRENLRVATSGQNRQNSGLAKNNVSGYKGVSWRKREKCWVAQIAFNKKKIHIGYFDKPEEAALAYDRKAQELFGDFASLNFKD